MTTREIASDLRDMLDVLGLETSEQITYFHASTRNEETNIKAETFEGERFRIAIIQIRANNRRPKARKKVMA